MMMAGARWEIVFGLLMAFSAMAFSLPAYFADDNAVGPTGGGECQLCTCAKNFPPALPSALPCFSTALTPSGQTDPKEPRASEGPILPIGFGRSPPISLS